jgi:hypothetical protein
MFVTKMVSLMTSRMHPPAAAINEPIFEKII